MSRTFKAALIGLTLTVVAELGPWYWPGWPAITVLDFVLARTEWSVVPPLWKAIGFVALIVINAGFWGVVAWLGMWGWSHVSGSGSGGVGGRSE